MLREITSSKTRIGLLGVVVVLIIIYGFISFLIAQGVVNVDRKAQEDDPSKYNLTYEDVEFSSRDGLFKLSGWYLPGEEGSPHLVFVHGNGSVRSGDNAVEIASRLKSLGFGMLLFDMRGRGSSEGDIASGGYFERQDVLGAYDYLLADRDAEAGRVGLLGFSLGAATSVMTAGMEPGFAAVVADSPFADAGELVTTEAARSSPIPRWLVPIFVPAARWMAQAFYDINIGNLSPERAAAGLGYPILVIHGEEDQRIPWEHGQRVADATPAGSSFWLVPEVDHVDAFLAHPDEYTDRVSEYFGSRLR